MSPKETTLMKRVKEKFCPDQSLTDYLVNKINETGNKMDTATELGISKATLGYWLLKAGVRTRTVALRPDEEIQIVKTV